MSEHWKFCCLVFNLWRLEKSCCHSRWRVGVPLDGLWRRFEDKIRPYLPTSDPVFYLRGRKCSHGAVLSAIMDLLNHVKEFLGFLMPFSCTQMFLIIILLIAGFSVFELYIHLRENYGKKEENDVKRAKKKEECAKSIKDLKVRLQDDPMKVRGYIKLYNLYRKYSVYRILFLHGWTILRPIARVGPRTVRSCVTEV